MGGGGGRCGIPWEPAWNHGNKCAAVGNNGRAFEAVVGTFKSDKEVVIAAVPNNGLALGLAAGTVKSDTYFERRKFPTFDGQRRNLPSFKKEWRTCIQPSFGVEFQLNNFP